MQRRDFLKITTAGALLYSVAPRALSAPPEGASWRTFKLTYHVELPADGTSAKLWLPLPETGSPDYQATLGSTWSGTARRGKFHRTPDAVNLFYAEWKGAGPRQVTVETQVRTLDRRVAMPAAVAGEQPLRPEVRRFLKPSRNIPLDGIVRDTAQKITSGVDAPLQKARAIYEWVVENSFREPTVKGCGRGDIKFMLESGNLGGKCADINSLFVGLARAAGIPAREEFGIRVADSRIFKSIGKSGDVSKAQHCRAEFYLAGTGWVPVDPADVRKVILEENIPLDDPRVQELKEKLFGSWEMNWVALNHARDFRMNPRTDSTNGYFVAAGQFNYFMYPHAEIEGKERDSHDPKGFVYRIESSEVA